MARFTVGPNPPQPLSLPLEATRAVYGGNYRLFGGVTTPDAANGPKNPSGPTKTMLVWLGPLPKQAERNRKPRGPTDRPGWRTRRSSFSGFVPSGEPSVVTLDHEAGK